MAECIFCKILAGEIPCTKILETERSLAFADINPATRGHALVIPKAHSVNVFDIAEEDVLDVMALGRRIAQAMPEALGCKGVNLFHCADAVAWQCVFHFHLHVIPRYERDELTAPWTMTPGDMKDIAAAAKSISDRLA